MEYRVFSVRTGTLTISELSDKLLNPIQKPARVRNTTYVVVRKAVPYLKAPIPRSLGKLSIDTLRYLSCNFAAKIFFGKVEKRTSRIRHEVITRIRSRHGKVALHLTALEVLRFGQDTELKRGGTHEVEAVTAVEHNFVSIDGLSQTQEPAKFSSREVQARAKVCTCKRTADLALANENRCHVALRAHKSTSK